MKKSAILAGVLMLLSISSFSQVPDSDIKIVQQYFGAEKTVLVRDYMELTPSQDSLFWDDYNAYETERLELGKRRIQLVDKYITAISNMDGTKATELVNEANAIDIGFKQLQKKYFKKMSKTIGAVKASQFYQMEGYLNNVINLGIQENIPFVGEMEQMHDKR